MPHRAEEEPTTQEIVKSTRSELTDKEFEYLIQPLIRAMHVLTNELTLAREENEKLRTKRDRLADGIRDINRMLRNSRYAEARQRSRSLLDVAGDDTEGGT